MGADDYVTKPFGTLEFMSRINALCAAQNKRNRNFGKKGEITIKK
jgi:DNA-binding response OmpR family regulator